MLKKFSPLGLLPEISTFNGWPTFQESNRQGSLYKRPSKVSMPTEPQVYALGLPESPELSELWIQILGPHSSAERRSRAERYHRRMDVLRCLASEALLWQAMQDIHGLDPSALGTTLGLHGKPQFRHFPGIHFNLSHSGFWILCAVHGTTLGVDVEVHGSRGMEAVDQFMSVEETRHHQALQGEDRQWNFFRLWTLKESLLKAAGTGFTHDSRLISIRLEPDGFQVHGGPQPPLGHQWSLNDLPMPSGVMAALCFARGSVPV